MENDAVLTKDNMIKRKWTSNPSCYFCSNHETSRHLFFTCPVAKVIWGIVGTSLGADNIPSILIQNNSWVRHWLPGGESIYMIGLAAVCRATWKQRKEACFDNKMLRNPTEIMIYACALMSFWAGLYDAEMHGKILEGVKILLSCVQWVTTQQRRQPPPRLLLGSTQDQEFKDEPPSDRE